MNLKTWLCSVPASSCQSLCRSTNINTCAAAPTLCAVCVNLTWRGCNSIPDTWLVRCGATLLSVCQNMDGISSIDVISTMSYISIEKQLYRDNYCYHFIALPDLGRQAPSSSAPKSTIPYTMKPYVGTGLAFGGPHSLNQISGPGWPLYRSGCTWVDGGS